MSKDPPKGYRDFHLPTAEVRWVGQEAGVITMEVWAAMKDRAIFACAYDYCDPGEQKTLFLWQMTEGREGYFPVFIFTPDTGPAYTLYEVLAHNPYTGETKHAFWISAEKGITVNTRVPVKLPPLWALYVVIRNYGAERMYYHVCAIGWWLWG